MLQPLHISIILCAIGLVLLNDFIGFLWVVGLKSTLSGRYLRTAHALIGFAFLAAVGTGVALSITKPEVFRHDGIWIKIAFVALIGVNGLFIGRKGEAIAQRRFKALPGRSKLSLGAHVMLSLFLWLSTAVIGLFVMGADF